MCPEVYNATLSGTVQVCNNRVTNPAIIFLHQDDDTDNVNCDTSVTFIWSFVVAIFCIGGMMGGSVVGLVSSRLGR